MFRDQNDLVILIDVFGTSFYQSDDGIITFFNISIAANQSGNKEIICLWSNMDEKKYRESFNNFVKGRSNRLYISGYDKIINRNNQFIEVVIRKKESGRKHGYIFDHTKFMECFKKVYHDLKSISAFVINSGDQTRPRLRYFNSRDEHTDIRSLYFRLKKKSNTIKCLLIWLKTSEEYNIFHHIPFEMIFHIYMYIQHYFDELMTLSK
jgi:hypothetical protein